MSDASYMAAYRAKNPAYARREAARNTARGVALEALARRHQDEFDVIYNAELRRRGIVAVPMERKCSCGGVIRRKSPTGRWPAKCDECRGADRKAAELVADPEFYAARRRLAIATAEAARRPT